MKLIALSLFLLLAHGRVLAQGSRADYDRAANLSRLTANTVFRDRVELHWLAGRAQFWYDVKTGPDAHEFVFVDAERGERRPAFDHARMAEALRKAGVKDAEAARLPLRGLEWKDADTLEFAAGGKQWRAALANYSLAEVRHDSPETSTALGPDEAPTRSNRTGAETSLTFINRTADEVEIFWLDTEGQRRSYGRLRAGESREQHTFAGHVWLAATREGKTVAVFQADTHGGDALITGTPTDRSRARPRTEQRQRSRNQSPDGKWRVSLRDFNVVLTDTGSGREFPLTTDGREGESYRERFYWSPDSMKLVAVRVEKGEEHKVYVIESSPKDQVQPKLHSFDYLKPGDKLPHPHPVLFDIPTKKRLAIDEERFANPFTESGDMDIRWAPDSSRFTFRYNQRGHQVLRMIAVDGATGAARAIVDEQSRTFIDYSGKFFAEFIDDTGELIWMSERDGWNHLYLYDAKTGREKNQITRGEWVVRDVVRVDKERRQIWFRAGAILRGQDPYLVHYCRVNFDGSSLTVLTEGNGNHEVDFSPDRRYLIDRYSRVDLAPVTELRRADDGRLVCMLERADTSALVKTGWSVPEPFVAKGRDGATDIYGVIMRPMNFDQSKTYPVIENIYAGPQGAFVPKSFRSFYGMQEMAELGFIVVQVDGMGTSNRSKKFHDPCWKNLADAGLPDHIAWIKAAAAKYPQMDLARVGIYGGSAGGQNSTRAMLDHGDFYKVCVSDCGCHDNRMDKIWWNEQWMGWPVDESYARNSNVTDAHKLTGKLMLVVGEMDRNVDPASTMQVVNALVKANKDFDLLVIPGANHGSAETPYGKRRRADYFVRNLLGKEPRW